MYWYIDNLSIDIHWNMKENMTKQRTYIFIQLLHQSDRKKKIVFDTRIKIKNQTEKNKKKIICKIKKCITPMSTGKGNSSDENKKGYNKENVRWTTKPYDQRDAAG